MLLQNGSYIFIYYNIGRRLNKMCLLFNVSPKVSPKNSYRNPLTL